MRYFAHISALHRTVIGWYMLLLVFCFGLCYILAGPYDLVQKCEDGLHFFTHDSCGQGIRPFVVKMNAETLDPRVSSLRPPMSYTRGLGWHVLGTDVLGRDVFAGILYGGQRSLLIGFLAGGLAMVIGWFLGIWSVYVRYFHFRFPVFWVGMAILGLLVYFTGAYFLLLFVPGMLVFKYIVRRFPGKSSQSDGATALWGRWIEWYQALPDLLLILVLAASFGVLNLWGLVLIITAVVWPSIALVARRLAAEVSQQPYFTQALRNRVSGKALIFHYLWGNSRSAFRALFPLVVARIILLESTISFLGMGLPPDMVTIGSMISGARHDLSAWWLIVFSCLFIFSLVYPLMLLGRKTGRQT